MLNNRVFLKGNLTKDPEYKTIAKDSGESDLVAFRVAVNETIGGREETVYFDVDGWNSHSKYAQSVLLAKGDRVIIDGRIRQREWVDKNGSNRTSYSVVPTTFSKVVKPTNI
jgi:single-strand DNA-binding protein